MPPLHVENSHFLLSKLVAIGKYKAGRWVMVVIVTKERKSPKA